MTKPSSILMTTEMALAAALSIFCLLLASSWTATAQNSPDDFLRLHNEVRAKVGVAPLVWDDKLAAYAKDYASKRTDCQLVHSGGPYGENIYEGFGVGYNDATAAVTWWAAEAKFYDYDSNTCTASQEYGTCLHYTQIVWANSARLGCARVHCGGGADGGGGANSVGDLKVAGEGGLGVTVGGGGVDLGIGGSVDATKSFVTCNYDPPGNYIGQRPY